MSPLTQEKIRRQQREDALGFVNRFTSRVTGPFVILGFIYLGGHIAMWYFKGMPVPN